MYIVNLFIHSSIIIKFQISKGSEGMRDVLAKLYGIYVEFGVKKVGGREKDTMGQGENGVGDLFREKADGFIDSFMKGSL